jgi:hypothetical protein
VVDVLLLLDELCALEQTRQARLLSKPELHRWRDLQKQLTRALCDFTTASGMERRDTLRVPCPLEVRVQSSGSVFSGTAIDVSAGGIGVRASLLPAMGERVVLLSADEPPGAHFQLEVPGHVVWLRKLQHPLGAGFGVAFDPETPEHEARLAQLLLAMLRREREHRSQAPLQQK